MAMLKVLKYLSDAEYRSLLQTAERKTVKPGISLIGQGDEQSSLHIVMQGTAKVLRDHAGFSVDIASHGAGEVFGDASFIEGLPASAGVQAGDTGVTVIVISHENIGTYIQADPAFAGRFYQSLAALLARRVRNAIEGVDRSQDPDDIWGNP